MMPVTMRIRAPSDRSSPRRAEEKRRRRQPRRRRSSCSVETIPSISTLLLVALITGSTAAFTVLRSRPSSVHPPPSIGRGDVGRTATELRGRSGGDNRDFDLDTLQDRLLVMRANIMEEEYTRPPNPDLSPTEFVSEILRGLWNNSDPLPDSGFRMLLRASTKEWRREVYHGVAAPDTADEEVVAQAVGEAMQRPRNQFQILVGEAEDYVASFPAVQDYQDGTCWVECRLRDRGDDRLLVVTGWNLEQRNTDGAWLVARIDWQDFRGEFFFPSIVVLLLVCTAAFGNVQVWMNTVSAAANVALRSCFSRATKKTSSVQGSGGKSG